MSKQHREVGYVGKPGEQPLNLQSLCDRLNEMFNVDDTPDELSTEAREAIEALWEERDQLVLKLEEREKALTTVHSIAAGYEHTIRDLQSRLDSAAERIKALETTHEHHAERTRLAESRLEALIEAVQQAVIDWDTIDDWPTTREATEKNMRELHQLIRVVEKQEIKS